MRVSQIPLGFVTTLGAICLLSSTAFPQDWTQWRGPNRDGSYDGFHFPDDLSEPTLSETWSIPLEPSYSGPIVVGDRVYITETRDKATEHVTCYNWKTQTQIWETGWEGAMKVPFFAAKNGSWIRSTPLFHAGLLYVGGMLDYLVCLDASTGDIIWDQRLDEVFDAPKPEFGFVSSPIIHDGALYVQGGGGFVKLDPKTGEIHWRVLVDSDGMLGSAFSSPTFSVIQETPTLVVQTRSDLTGIAPDSGEVLWRQPVKAFRGMNILTPTIHDSKILTSSYGGKSHLFEPVTTSVGGSKSWTVNELWANKLQGYMSSPTVIDGFAYLQLKNQRAACFEVATGDIRWISTRRFGKYWSTIHQKDRILALDQTGELLLIRAQPEKLEILDRREISDQDTWAHIAAAPNKLFVRELKGLRVFQWSQKGSTATGDQEAAPL